MIGKVITWEAYDQKLVVGIVYEVIDDAIYHRMCIDIPAHDNGFMYRKDIKIL